MANHRIPAASTRIEDLSAPDANGATVRCRVYRHTRAGYSRPDFYVVQYRETGDGRVEPGSRWTQQFTGPRAQVRLDAAMASARSQFADACADAATARSVAWMAAGSPAHGFEPWFGRWCGQCGCGAPGRRHWPTAAEYRAAVVCDHPGGPCAPVAGDCLCGCAECGERRAGYVAFEQSRRGRRGGILICPERPPPHTMDI
jgi:hypothetical protein